MTLANLQRRLVQIEERRGFALRGDVRLMSDAQLEAAIQQSYADLRAEHGSLAAAFNLRATGDEGDAALAQLIEEDIGGPDARFH